MDGKLIYRVDNDDNNRRDGPEGGGVLVGLGHVLRVPRLFLSPDDVRHDGTYGAMVKLPAATGAKL